jgi:hypothetical protein
VLTEREQVKEEMGNDPEFFKPYSVTKANGDAAVGA